MVEWISAAAIVWLATWVLAAIGAFAATATVWLATTEIVWFVATEIVWLARVALDYVVTTGAGGVTEAVVATGKVALAEAVALAGAVVFLEAVVLELVVLVDELLAVGAGALFLFCCCCQTVFMASRSSLSMGLLGWRDSHLTSFASKNSFFVIFAPRALGLCSGMESTGFASSAFSFLGMLGSAKGFPFTTLVRGGS